VPLGAVAIAGQPEIVLGGAQLSGRFAVMVVPARPAVAPRALWLKIPPPSVPAELPVIELLLHGGIAGELAVRYFLLASRLAVSVPAATLRNLPSMNRRSTGTR
jgi:hypothetical protein